MAPTLWIKMLSKASDLDFQNQTSRTTCEFSLRENVLMKSGLLNENRPEIAWKNGQNGLFEKSAAIGHLGELTKREKSTSKNLLESKIN